MTFFIFSSLFYSLYKIATIVAQLSSESKQIDMAGLNDNDGSLKTLEDTGIAANILIDKFNYYKPLFPMGWKYFKKLLKAIRFYDTDILLVTAKPDAYESAMFYGKLQIALNNLMALLCGIFTVRVKKLGVKCEFNDDKLDYYASCKVKLRPSTVIAIAVCVLINYLLFRHKRKKEAKKEKLRENEELTQEKLSA